MPLTGAQLEALPEEAVVAALTAARRHLLAARVAGALGLGPEQVLRYRVWGLGSSVAHSIQPMPILYFRCHFKIHFVVQLHVTPQVPHSIQYFRCKFRFHFFFHVHGSPQQNDPRID